MISHRRLYLVVAALLCGSETLANADLPRAISVTADANCPSAQDVNAELHPLLPSVTLGVAGQGIAVTLREDGPHYQVSIESNHRDFVDEKLQCAERAKTVAVFILLTLQPPLIPIPSAEKPPKVVAPIAPPPRHKQFPYVDVELSTGFEVAPRSGSNGTLWTGIASIRGVVSANHVAAVVGVSGAFPTLVGQVADASVRINRLPLDVSLRGWWRKSRIELSGDLGLTTTVTWVRGLNLVGSATQTRLDTGIRLAAGLRIWLTKRISLSLSIDSTILPKPYQLVVNPEGVVGSLPELWLGASAGLIVRLR